MYKHYVVHPDVATIPALAACAAQQQEKFVEMEALIWEKGFDQRDLSPERMFALAAELGLDADKFEADMTGQTCQQRIAADQEQLQQFGVNGTPAFFINGRFLSGAQPLQAFKQVVDEELAKAEAAIAKGTPMEQYYQVAVIGRGLKQLETD